LFVKTVENSIYPHVEPTAGRKHRSKKLDNVTQLLAAALLAGQAEKYLAVRRCKHDLFAAMADELVWHGYIGKATGNKWAGRVTRFWITDKGKQALAKFPAWPLVLDPLLEPTSILRGKRLPGATPLDIKHRAARIAKLNKFNFTAWDWQYVDENGKTQPLMTCVRLINGGRMYSYTVHGYQSLKRTVRRSITVDGDPVVELDFSGFHPRILYHWEQIDFRGDVYQPDALFSAVYDAGFMSGTSALNGFTKEQIEQAARTIAKRTLNIVLNSANESKAKASIQRLLNGWQTKNKKCQHSRRRYRLYQTIINCCGTNADGIVEAVMAVHRPIAHYFFTGVGSRLQVFDSRLMIDILEKMMQRNMPALGIHDSVLCRCQDWRAARAIMRQSYLSHFGHDPKIDEKRSCLVR
jgi:hypothetical protein